MMLQSIARVVDRNVDLWARCHATDETSLRRELSSELRQLEKLLADLLQRVRASLPPSPPSRTSQKASAAQTKTWEQERARNLARRHTRRRNDGAGDLRNAAAAEAGVDGEDADRSSLPYTPGHNHGVDDAPKECRTERHRLDSLEAGEPQRLEGRQIKFLLPEHRRRREDAFESFEIGSNDSVRRIDEQD